MSNPSEASALSSLQSRLHARARELESAGGTIHKLKLEILARDRQIYELKTRVMRLEAEAVEPQRGTDSPVGPRAAEHAELNRLKIELASRAQDLELHDQIVTAAERERATYRAYIDYLQGELAESQLQP